MVKVLFWLDLLLILRTIIDNGLLFGADLCLSYANNLADEISKFESVFLNDEIGDKIFFFLLSNLTMNLKHSLKDWPPDVKEL